MNKRRAFVTGGTKEDVDAMAVLALNIRRICPGIADEMIIFHDGISTEVQEKFKQIMPTTFITYKCPVPKYKLWMNKTIRYFSQMVFCKIECFRLLEQYDTVIWSDYDVLIKEDICEITEQAAAYSFICNDETALKDMFHKNISRIDMKEYDMQGRCICTPLFVLKRNQDDYMLYYKWCYETLNKYVKYLYLPEQCIFTMLVQKFDLKYNVLDLRKYCTHPKEDGADVKIIHAYGQPKFWNGLTNKKWNEYYDEWNRVKNS